MTLYNHRYLALGLCMAMLSACGTSWSDYNTEKSMYASDFVNPSIDTQAVFPTRFDAVAYEVSDVDSINPLTKDEAKDISVSYAYPEIKLYFPLDKEELLAHTKRFFAKQGFLVNASKDDKFLYLTNYQSPIVVPEEREAKEENFEKAHGLVVDRIKDSYAFTVHTDGKESSKLVLMHHPVYEVDGVAYPAFREPFALKIMAYQLLRFSGLDAKDAERRVF